MVNVPIVVIKSQYVWGQSTETMSFKLLLQLYTIGFELNKMDMALHTYRYATYFTVLVGQHKKNYSTSIPIGSGSIDKSIKPISLPVYIFQIFQRTKWMNVTVTF